MTVEEYFLSGMTIKQRGQYIKKIYKRGEICKREIIEKKNDDYILHQLDFLIYKLWSSKWKNTVRENQNIFFGCVTSSIN